MHPLRLLASGFGSFLLAVSLPAQSDPVGASAPDAIGAEQEVIVNLNLGPRENAGAFYEVDAGYTFIDIPGVSHDQFAFSSSPLAGTEDNLDGFFVRGRVGFVLPDLAMPSWLGTRPQIELAGDYRAAVSPAKGSGAYGINDNIHSIDGDPTKSRSGVELNGPGQFRDELEYEAASAEMIVRTRKFLPGKTSLLPFFGFSYQNQEQTFDSNAEPDSGGSINWLDEELATNLYGFTFGADLEMPLEGSGWTVLTGLGLTFYGGESDFDGTQNYQSVVDTVFSTSKDYTSFRVLGKLGLQYTDSTGLMQLALIGEIDYLHNFAVFTNPVNGGTASDIDLVDQTNFSMIFRATFYTP